MKRFMRNEFRGVLLSARVEKPLAVGGQLIGTIVQLFCFQNLLKGNIFRKKKIIKINKSFS